MKSNFIYFIFFAMLFSACNQKTQVDLIVKNATVYTVDSTSSITESFAIKDSKIVGVGTNSEISESFVSSEILDLSGKFVYPGFNDAHCHFYGYGQNLRNADLTGTLLSQIFRYYRDDCRHVIDPDADQRFL